VTTFPERYRQVSVADVDVPLDEASLRALFLSRPVYRRTRYIVCRSGGRTALVEVTKPTEDPLFCDVATVELLAGPADTAYLVRPDVDTAVPSAVAQVAVQAAPGSRCVVVEGRYAHVSFVLDPAQRRVHVLDVAPPWPAKLVDQVERVLATADELPPVATVPRVVVLTDLLSPGETGPFLLQCRGGGVEVPGATVDYLDEIPAYRAGWTLLGCARSRQIHDRFFDAPVTQVDTCPRTLAASVDLSPGDVLLTKCCLLEEHVERDGRRVVVPWGASFTHVRDGLAQAVAMAVPADRVSAHRVPTDP
jgi:hypothetical protein